MVEPKGRGNVSKALNAAWIRPFLFLILIVVAGDFLATSIFALKAR